MRHNYKIPYYSLIIIIIFFFSAIISLFTDNETFSKPQHFNPVYIYPTIIKSISTLSVPVAQW